MTECDLPFLSMPTDVVVARMEQVRILVGDLRSPELHEDERDLLTRAVEVLLESCDMRQFVTPHSSTTSNPSTLN